MGCGSSDKQYVQEPRYFDPLGPNAQGSTSAPTGGPEARKRIFDWLSANTPDLSGATNRVVGAANSAASDPGWGQAAGLARREMAGDYLNPAPQVTNALKSTRAATDKALGGMRNATMASAANNDALLRSQFSQAGMPFSTAYQQASQANLGAANARQNELEAQAYANLANSENSALMQNYMQERANQDNALKNLAVSTAAPLDYLSKISQAQVYGMEPAAQAASIVRALAGQGQIATPTQDVVKQPGALDYTMGFLGALSPLGGLLG